MREQIHTTDMCTCMWCMAMFVLKEIFPDLFHLGYPNLFTHIANKRENIRVYLGVKTCEVFLCFLATGYYFPWLYCVEFSVASLYSLFYVTREFQFTPRMSRTFSRMQSIHFRFRIQNLPTREQLNPLGRSYFGLTHLRIKSKTNPLQKCSRFVITPEKSPLVYM